MFCHSPALRSVFETELLCNILFSTEGKQGELAGGSVQNKKKKKKLEEIMQ